jgi:hypothetical protein
MPGPRTNSGRRLNREWGVNARHALYHQDGNWYEELESFPGALFDRNGYVVFQTEDEYRNSPHLRHGSKLHVNGNIAQLPGYTPRPANR